MSEPYKALKHIPMPAPWGGDELVWRPAMAGGEGVTAGWAWSTDTATAAGHPSDAEPTTGLLAPMGSKVVGWLTASGEPMWAVRLSLLALTGGFGDVPEWGVVDLDRIYQAACWVDGDEDFQPDDVVLVELQRLDRSGQGEPASMLRLTSPHTNRVAVVVAARDRLDPKATYFDDWLPTISLPMRELAGAS